MTKEYCELSICKGFSRHKAGRFMWSMVRQAKLGVSYEVKVPIG